MSRQIFVAVPLTACALVFSLLGETGFAQGPRVAAGPEPSAFASLEGKYQGTAESSSGVMVVRCDLRVLDSQVVGTLRIGDDFFTVAGGTLSGNALTLNLDSGDTPILVTGSLKAGRFDGNDSDGRTIVMTRLDQVAPVIEPPGAVAPRAAASAPRTAAGPDMSALSALAGAYRGEADTANGVARVRCDLRVVDGDVIGTLRLGDDFFEVTDGTRAGADVTLNLDLNGIPITVKGTFRAGSFEMHDSPFGPIVLVKVVRGA